MDAAMNTSTVTQKGQIVIPAALRQKLGFEPGTKVIITEGKEGEVRVHPASHSYFERFAGLLSEEEGSTTEALLSERNLDRKREASSTEQFSR